MTISQIIFHRNHLFTSLDQRKKIYHIPKKILLVFCIFLINSHLFAQFGRSTLDNIQKHTQIIIEGRVIDKQFFKIDDDIFTEYIVFVDKVIKGEFENSEISIISEGGTLNGVTENCTHALDLELGEFGAFFINPFPDKTIINKFTVYKGAYGFFRYFNNKGLLVKSIGSKYYGINEFYYKIGYRNNYSLIQKEFFRLHTPDDCIKYRLEPVLPDNSISKNTNIELNIYASIQNGEYRLYSSEFSLKYSTLWFGDSLVFNGKISDQIGSNFANNYDFEINDMSIDILSIKLAANDIIFDSLQVIGSTEKLIATLYINILNIGDDKPVSENTNGQPENMYLDSANEIHDFNCFSIDFGRDDCEPIIDSITIKAAAGVDITATTGTNGLMTIYGHNFIDSAEIEHLCVLPNSQHRVRFNTVEGSWIAALEGDYVSWSDTKIEVKVPTTGYFFDEDDNAILKELSSDFVAAKGAVQVCIDDTFFGGICACNDISSDSINVPFTAKNKHYELSQKCKNYHGQGYFQNLDRKGGQSFHFSDQIKNNSIFIPAFTQAMNTWRCKTGINLNISESSGPDVIEVQFGESTGGRAAFTRTSQFDCNFPIDKDIIVSKNMIFDSTLTWIDSIPITSTEYDIETVALHEIGHVIGLGHTLDTLHIMRVGGHKYNRTLSSADIDGGKHIAFLGLIQACENPMILVDSASCITAIYENEINDQIKIKLFPNPSSQTISLNQISMYYNNTALKIFNSLGVKQFEVDDINLKKYQIDISSLAVGYYYLVIYHDGVILSTRKFIKQ